MNESRIIHDCYIVYGLVRCAFLSSMPFSHTLVASSASPCKTISTVDLASSPLSLATLPTFRFFLQPRRPRTSAYLWSFAFLGQAIGQCIHNSI